MGLILKFAIFPPQRDLLLFTAENAEVNQQRKSTSFLCVLGACPVAPADDTGGCGE